MIKSMTGYGVANLENDDYIINVEVKTLNSKFLDLSLRSPRQFSDKELEVRNVVNGILERGKVNLTIEFTAKKSNELPVSINEELFEAYFEKYATMAGKVGVDSPELFKIALQSPNVTSVLTESASGDADWEVVKRVMVEALEHCDEYRKDEGAVLARKMEENISIIRDGLKKVEVEDPIRKDRIKERIRNNFKEFLDENSFDANRFEQELIYYFEKIDITEEIVRLGTHLDYFDKILSSDKSQGKKLGFISQEIGREINTIGSKANDASIQRHVIIMKDELEKIKEQALNIL
ncbi:YicC family protein [Litoribacter alkaliphilus]|uniref:YicC family protein n=1 Tax=Litoribacter ruber TaxID=702568 RepID=A0AAP2CGV1_9BACT|nr:YicC/YloC family endoribonuclease [Litoribacter alkaliphilus]MBS9522956.1 YicC family protein [Litoribacter alkaliphilus]